MWIDYFWLYTPITGNVDMPRFVRSLTVVRLMKPTTVGFIRYGRRRSDRIRTARFVWEVGHLQSWFFAYTGILIRKSKDYVYGIWVYKALGIWKGYYRVKKSLVSYVKPWTEARYNKYMKYHSKLTYQLSFWNVSRKVDYHAGGARLGNNTMWC